MLHTDIMYTICTKEEWRSKYFDPWFCEVTYGIFFNYKAARGAAIRLAPEEGGVIIELPKDVICNSNNPY